MEMKLKYGTHAVKITLQWNNGIMNKEHKCNYVPFKGGPWSS